MTCYLQFLLCAVLLLLSIKPFVRSILGKERPHCADTIACAVVVYKPVRMRCLILSILRQGKTKVYAVSRHSRASVSEKI